MLTLSRPSFFLSVKCHIADSSETHYRGLWLSYIKKLLRRKHCIALHRIAVGGYCTTQNCISGKSALSWFSAPSRAEPSRQQLPLHADTLESDPSLIRPHICMYVYVQPYILYDIYLSTLLPFNFTRGSMCSPLNPTATKYHCDPLI